MPSSALLGYHPPCEQNDPPGADILPCPKLRLRSSNTPFASNVTYTRIIACQCTARNSISIKVHLHLENAILVVFDFYHCSVCEHLRIHLYQSKSDVTFQMEFTENPI